MWKFYPAFLLIFFLTGCQFFNQPLYIIKKEKRIVNCAKFRLLDINGDGSQELIYISELGKGLKDYVGSIISIPGPDNITMWMQKPLKYIACDYDVCDISGNNDNRIIVSFISGNRSFLQIFRIEKDNIVDNPAVLISSGKDNFSKYNDKVWDGSLEIGGFKDFNHDGFKDVLLEMDVGYDKGKRGVTVFDIKNRKLLWKYPTGTRIEDIHICDIDNNGSLEIFLDTTSPENSLTVNGTADTCAYYLVLDEKGKAIFKEPYGVRGGSLTNYICDMDDDGRKEIVQFFQGNWTKAKSQSHLRILEWGETEHKKKIPLRTGAFRHRFIQGNLDSKFYFLYETSNKKYLLNVLNDKFEMVKQIPFKFPISSFLRTVDIDGDGIKDMIVRTEGKDEIRKVANLNFSRIASFKGINSFYSRRTSPTTPPELLAHTPDNTLWEISLQPNYARYYIPLKWFAIFAPWFLLVLIILYRIKKRSSVQLPLINEIYFRNLNTGIILLDEQERVILINARASRLSKLMIKTPIHVKAMLEKLPDSFREKLEKALKNPRSASFEDSISTDSEVKNVYVNVSTLYDSKNQFIGKLITLEDLTGVIHFQRSSAWAALTRHIAHDIKNPLSNVKLSLERLKIDSKNIPPKYKSKSEVYLKAIEEDINLVRKVTDGFLQFSSLSKPNIGVVKIHDLIDAIIDKHLPLIGNRIIIKREYTKQCSDIHADSEQINRALDNILDNSIKAIESEGTIIISTTVQETDLNETGELKQYLEIQIEDTGHGIEPDLLTKVFEPFVTGTKSGTGLGLAIIKKIVEDHNGQANIHSKVGVGTRISLLLPLQ